MYCRCPRLWHRYCFGRLHTEGRPLNTNHLVHITEQLDYFMMINAVLSFVYVAFLCFGSGSRASGRRLPEEYPQNAGTGDLNSSILPGARHLLQETAASSRRSDAGLYTRGSLVLPPSPPPLPGFPKNLVPPARVPVAAADPPSQILLPPSPPPIQWMQDIMYPSTPVPGAAPSQPPFPARTALEEPAFGSSSGGSAPLGGPPLVASSPEESPLSGLPPSSPLILGLPRSLVPSAQPPAAASAQGPVPARTGLGEPAFSSSSGSTSVGIPSPGPLSSEPVAPSLQGSPAPAPASTPRPHPRIAESVPSPLASPPETALGEPVFFSSAAAPPLGTPAMAPRAPELGLKSP